MYLCRSLRAGIRSLDNSQRGMLSPDGTGHGYSSLQKKKIVHINIYSERMARDAGIPCRMPASGMPASVAFCRRMPDAGCRHASIRGMLSPDAGCRHGSMCGSLLRQSAIP